jgi:IS1 family transposase
MIQSYVLFSELCQIYEFMVSACSKYFFEIGSLNFSRLSNFLKNISSRIIEPDYFKKFQDIIERNSPGRGYHYYLKLLYPLMGIILSFNENKKLSSYDNFINKIIATSDLDIEPLKKFPEMLVINGEYMRDQVALYQSIINEYSMSKKKKVEKKMSIEEWEEKTTNDKTCILCYSNPNNRELQPCKHCKIYFLIF